MRRLAFMMAAVLAAGAASAQEAVIRIEAKRGAAQAAQAAAKWRESFDDVVTFPLTGGWIAIALGPQERSQAEARLAGLKAANRVPGDSFVAEPAAGIALSPVAADAVATPSPVPEDGGPLTGASQDAARPAATTSEGEAATPDRTPMPEAGSYLRLESLRGDAESRAALSKWRETFPEAGLMALPGGWRTITLGPLPAEAAAEWLAAFKASGDVPRDAFLSQASDLGEVIEPGAEPDLPASAGAQEMPPVDEIQRALRWAGRYDGAVDGQWGPDTRKAVAREVAEGRLSPDPGTAMRRLIERRDAWRRTMGLTTLTDEQTGLSVSAPMDKLAFERAERALSIYGPRQDSGVALILFSQPGGQQELLDLSGLVTALGWVPHPTRMIEPGHILLKGANMAQSAMAEGWVRDGRAEGFVLIWPAGDQENQARVAAELSDSFARVAPAKNDGRDPFAVSP